MNTDIELYELKKLLNTPEYKYIVMDERDNGSKKTRYWVVRNSKSGDPLGAVEWYVYWRQYVFHANGQSVFSAGCLKDIADFCERMTKEQKHPVSA